MPELVAGIDFGTSNSTAALASADWVRTIVVDPESTLPGSCPTLMYFDEDAAPRYATAAIRAYIANEMHGRLLQSIKRYLPSPGFEGTWIAGRLVTIETLVSGFLRYVRDALEEHAGGRVSRVVLGRPALFHDNPDRDALAQGRLERAAHMAGFDEVVFQIEPIAAARTFEERLPHSQLCLVGDLGGGTSDFSVVRLSPRRVGSRDRVSDVLGSSGVSVAGNDLDAVLIRRFILPSFGLGTTYRPMGREVAFPTFLHHAMTRWHQLCIVATDKNLEFLRRGMRTASDQVGLARLYEFLDANYAWQLYRAVEDAKIALSSSDSTTLRFHQGDIDFEIPISREAFERSTGREVQALGDCMDQLLSRIGIDHADISVVFLTGGTSKVPFVRRLFSERFPGRIVPQDAFTSVGYGLGVEASQVFFED